MTHSGLSVKHYKYHFFCLKNASRGYIFYSYGGFFVAVTQKIVEKQVEENLQEIILEQAALIRRQEAHIKALEDFAESVLSDLGKIENSIDGSRN